MDNCAVLHYPFGSSMCFEIPCLFQGGQWVEELASADEGFWDEAYWGVMCQVISRISELRGLSIS